MSVDPVASEEPSVSPYHYTHNNPINRYDPDGNDDFKYFLMPGETDFDVNNRWDRLALGNTKRELYYLTSTGPKYLDPSAEALAWSASSTFIIPKLSVILGISSTVVQSFSTYLKKKHLELKEDYDLKITNDEIKDLKGDYIGIPVSIPYPAAGVVVDKLYESLNSEGKIAKKSKIHRLDVIRHSMMMTLLKSVAAERGMITSPSPQEMWENMNSNDEEDE